MFASRGAGRVSASRPEGVVPTSCVPACPTCSQLRADALRIIGSEGIDGLTIYRLAGESGLAAEQVMAHYPTASGCLYDTYEEVALSIYLEFRWAFESEEGWRDALQLAATTLLRRIGANPAEARLCFAEILQGDYELLRRREASRRRLVNLFVSELGRRREDAETFRVQLELLIGVGFQTIAAAVLEERVGELDELSAELESRAFLFEPVAA